MPKKDKQNAQPETPEKEPQAAAAEEKELPPEDKKEEAKAETFTVTREQMEKMEGLAKQLAEEHDQYLRLANTITTASAPPRKRKASTPTRKSTPSRVCFRCTTISSAASPSSARRTTIPTRRGLR